MTKNQDIALIFYEIAIFLEMEDTSFRSIAYQKAAVVLDGLEEDVETIYAKGGKKVLESMPAIGVAIAGKIEEFLKTGKIKYRDELKKKTPVQLGELSRVEGVGPKKIKFLYQKLGVKNLKDLEKSAKAHRIASLPGFGEKSEKNILEGIAFLKRSKGRVLLGEILPVVERIQEELSKLREVQEIQLAGSIRRMKETIGDADILIIPKGASARKIMDYFCSLPGIVKVWGKGATKSSVRTEDGFDIDVRVVPRRAYGAALQYFTGSKEHNIAVRKMAIEKGLKLSEYGLFRGAKMIAGKTEEEVYEKLGIEWIPPEIRENQGEIEASLNKKLPKLISYGDIKGDLHCHSDWDGGVHSIREMAEAAINMGYEYLGISDHTKFLKIENGLDEKQLAAQRKEIDKVNKELQKRKLKFRILQGAETNILNDGSVDIKDEALKKLDYVIAGIHSSFKMSQEEMTERIIRAIKNPHINIIAHPTGRILKQRDEYQVNFGKVLKAAKETGTVLEINAFPSRLDLNDRNIRRAKEAGVKMTINTDAHHKDTMGHMKLGISQARRGWAEKKDIVNTNSLKKLIGLFHRR